MYLNGITDIDLIYTFTIVEVERWKDVGMSSPRPFRLVDVPGMGYAATVEQAVQQSWLRLLQDYLRMRPNLSTVLHLMDCRLPLTPVDLEVSICSIEIESILTIFRCNELFLDLLA